MSSLAEEIRQRFGDLSPAERKVARVLLAGYPAAGFETVATLAERATVSAPTVIRFVNRLGYKGFPDFQAALRGNWRNAEPHLCSSTAHGDTEPRHPALRARRGGTRRSPRADRTCSAPRSPAR